MEIIKRKSELGTYDISIKNDNKKLSIIFGGNLDLYFILSTDNREKYEDIINSKVDSFIITKENYFIYSVFEELINDIKDSKIFIQNNFDNELFSNIDFLQNDDYYQRRNEQLKKTWEYINLYDGENITWYSDDELSDIANILKIYKNSDEDIVLEFIRQNIKDKRDINFISNNIRIRNSGSRYNPYNIIFMRLYQKLTKYNVDYHQIHIEEHLYQKKKLLKK